MKYFSPFKPVNAVYFLTVAFALFCCTLFGQAGNTITVIDDGSCNDPSPGTTLTFSSSSGSPSRNSYSGTTANGGNTLFVQWSSANNRWEIRIIADIGCGSMNYLEYYNTYASAPNPPSLGTGTWVAVPVIDCDGVPFTCQNFIAFSGNGTQNFLGGSNPAGVTVTESDGSTNVTEGGATDDYTVVLTSQPTANVTINIVVGTAPLLTSLVANDATSGSAVPTGQVTTNPTSLTFTSSNWNMPQTVTVTAVDDADIEGPHSETIAHEISSADPNYSGISSNFSGIVVTDVNVSITDNDAAPLPTVNLSVDLTSGTEADATLVRVTATASAEVSGNQTVTLAVTGTGITADDYELNNITITILDGATTGFVNFTILDDFVDETNETATLTISSPSAAWGTSAR